MDSYFESASRELQAPTRLTQTVKPCKAGLPPGWRAPRSGSDEDCLWLAPAILSHDRKKSRNRPFFGRSISRLAMTHGVIALANDLA
jgi:hypothetical protein